MTLQKHHGALEIVFGLLAFFHGAAPEFALLFAAAAEREHHRQRDLAFAEIIADGLAELRLARRIVERIVDQLIGDAEIEAVILEALLLVRRALGDDATQLAGGGKEGRRWPRCRAL